MSMELTADEARRIACDAYIYGFPLVDSYRIQYSYFQNKDDPEFKAPWNTLKNIPRVYTPKDTAVQTPNSDTPYSMIGMDLRAEPLVLDVPPIEEKRYFSIQLIDAYTQNFAYVGSRATGNGGGKYLIAGPNWKGETPEGFAEVIRSETEFVLGIYRTQLFSPTDLDAVKAVQDQYKVVPLSGFLGRTAPAAAPAIDFVVPLSPADQRKSIHFYKILNFVLQHCPTVPSEVELMERFGKIGIGPGKTFDAASLSPEINDAIQQGMADALADFGAFQKKIEAGVVTSGQLLGTREFLKNDYMLRMAGAVNGIYGNSVAEAMYPFFAIDNEKQKLDGSAKYTLQFASGQLPPVNSFWSLTMYKMPESLLVDNPINRYLINSAMQADLKKDSDGGITLRVQAESPGKDLESNWLPAPKGPFVVVMRLYWPKKEAMDGAWKAPVMMKVK